MGRPTPTPKGWHASQLRYHAGKLGLGKEAQALLTKHGIVFKRGRPAMKKVQK